VEAGKKKSLIRMPTMCDGCEAAFTLNHALDCKKRGLITQKHNEVRDALGDIAALACKEVVREPVVREADEIRGVSAQVADFGVRGVWQPQTEVLFDVRVVDTDTQSYAHRTVSAVLLTAEKEKRKYTHAAQVCHASFSPFVVSVDGVMAREARFTVRFTDRLSTRWSKPYRQVMGWCQTRLSFAILRTANRCVQGSREKWRSGVGMDDGPGLALIMN